MLSVFFCFLMLFFIDALSHGRALWVPITCVSFLMLGILFAFAYFGDWFIPAIKRYNEKQEQKRKEQEEKEKELTYLEDFDYKKLAEEKAYFNDFDGPRDIEKFLVMLKQQHPELNWVEAVYVTYLTGRYHEEIYKN